MPKKTKKRKKTRGITKLGIILLFCVCLCGCAFVAELFSNVITVGYISDHQTAKSLKYEVYALSLGAYDTALLAEEYATNIQPKNAAGYIWKIDQKYHVLASAYEKENDAKLVKENLEEQKYQVEIVKLSFENIDLPIDNSDVKQAYMNCLKIFKSTYLKLYDISVALDTQVYNLAKAKIYLSEAKSEAQDALDQLKGKITSNTTHTFIQIKVKVNNVIDLLSELINYNEESIPLSAKIKFSYIQILELNKDLLDNLDKK